MLDAVGLQRLPFDEKLGTCCETWTYTTTELLFVALCQHQPSGLEGSLV